MSYRKTSKLKNIPLTICDLQYNFHGVHHTAESSSTVCITPRSQNRNLCESLGTFKETIRRNPFRGEHIYYERKGVEKKKCISYVSLKF